MTLSRWCAAQTRSQKISRPRNTGKQEAGVKETSHHVCYLRLEKHALNKEDFAFIMRNLPVPVAEAEIDEMFQFADKNNDGKLSFAEFELMVMINDEQLKGGNMKQKLSILNNEKLKYFLWFWAHGDNQQ